MKTKTFNHFRNIFAFVGFFIIACSAAVDDSPAVEDPPFVQNNIGKYQVSISSMAHHSNDTYNRNYMVVLNTETGVSKTYEMRRPPNQSWVEITQAAITFEH